MTPLELRHAYGLGPATTGDTLRALRILTGATCADLARACQTDRKTIATRMRQAECVFDIEAP